MHYTAIGGFLIGDSTPNEKDIVIADSLHALSVHELEREWGQGEDTITLSSFHHFS